jgi:hypothetical protein
MPTFLADILRSDNVLSISWIARAADGIDSVASDVGKSRHLLPPLSVIESQTGCSKFATTQYGPQYEKLNLISRVEDLFQNSH